MVDADIRLEALKCCQENMEGRILMTGGGGWVRVADELMKEQEEAEKEVA